MSGQLPPEGRKPDGTKGEGGGLLERSEGGRSLCSLSAPGARRGQGKDPWGRDQGLRNPNETPTPPGIDERTLWDTAFRVRRNGLRSISKRGAIHEVGGVEEES